MYIYRVLFNFISVIGIFLLDPLFSHLLHVNTRKVSPVRVILKYALLDKV